MFGARFIAVGFTSLALLFVGSCSDNSAFIPWVPPQPDSLVFVLQDSGTRAIGPWFADGPIEFEAAAESDDRLLVIPVAEILAANPHIDSSPEALLRADLVQAAQPECSQGSVSEEGSIAEIPLPAGSQLFEVPVDEERLIATSIDPASFIAQRRLLLELRDEVCPSSEMTEFAWSKEFLTGSPERLFNVWRLGPDEVLFHSTCCLYYVRRGEAPVIQRLSVSIDGQGYAARNIATRRDGARILIAVGLVAVDDAPVGALVRYILEAGVFSHQSTQTLPGPIRSVAFGPNEAMLVGDKLGFVYLGRTDSSTLTRVRLPESDSVERVGFTLAGEHLAASKGRFFHGDFSAVDIMQGILLIDRFDRVKKESARGLVLLDRDTVFVSTDGSGVFRIDLPTSTAQLVEMGIPKPTAPCDLQRFCNGADQVIDGNHMALFSGEPQRIFVTHSDCGVLVTHWVANGCTSDLRLPARRSVVTAEMGYLTVVSGDQILEARLP